MFRAVLAIVALGAAWAALYAQPGLDPWHRPLNPQGQSSGVTVGTTVPTTPMDGELMLDMFGAGDGGPQFQLYDLTNTEWDLMMTLAAAGTVNYVPKFEAGGTSLIDSQTIRSAGVPAANTDGDIVDIPVTLTVADAGNTVNTLLLDITNAVHLGAAEISGLNVTLDANSAASERAISISDNWDYDIFFAGTGNGIVHANASTLAIMTEAAGNILWHRDVPAAGASADLNEIQFTPSIMDNVGGDVQSAFVIDITNVAHTGGNLYGLEIEGIVQAAAAEEAAVFIGATWDIDIHFGSATALVNWFETGSLTISDYGGQNEIIFNDVAVDLAAPNTIMELDPTLSIMDAGADLQQVLHLDIDNVDHTAGAEVYGIHLDLDTNDADSNEFAMFFTATWDVDLGFANNNGITMRDFGADTTYEFGDIIAAAASGAQSSITTTLAAMDGTDEVAAFRIDVTNANHGGGAWSNQFHGLDLVIDAHDADSYENAIQVSGPWARAMRFDTDVTQAIFEMFGVGAGVDVQWYVGQGVNASYITFSAQSLGDAPGLLEITPPTQIIMNGTDTSRILEIDTTNANHTGAANYLYGLFVDDIAEDPDAFESPVFLDAGWDVHTTWQSLTAAPADNPPAGAIALFIGDNADYSGGGGNDCALVALDSTGAVDTIAVLVLNGACP